MDVALLVSFNVSPLQSVQVALIKDVKIVPNIMNFILIEINALKYAEMLLL